MLPREWTREGSLTFDRMRDLDRVDRNGSLNWERFDVAFERSKMGVTESKLWSEVPAAALRRDADR